MAALHILRDTREQIGWNFSLLDVTIENIKLPCGDYACGSQKVIVERKRNTSELYLNLFSSKKERERFRREIEKLKEFEYPRIVCEFPESRLYEFPKNSGINRPNWHKLKVPRSVLIREIKNLSNEIPVVMCLNTEDAEWYTYLLFRNAMGDYSEGDVLT